MALNLSSDDNSDLSALGVRVNEAGAVPTRPVVQSYLGSLADSYGLPQEVVHAVAQTQSGFASDTVRTNRPASDAAQLGTDSQRYGVMQVSDDQIGKKVRDADGTPFQIGENIKTDWKANADAGVALLAQHYRVAEIEQPYSTLEERAQQAYSGYSAGNANRDRYLVTLPYNNAPAHPDDRAFLQNLRNASAPAGEPAQDESPTQDSNQSTAQSTRTPQTGSQSNGTAANRISGTAQKYSDSESAAWAVDAKKDEFLAGTNKCNKFVGDVTAEAGATAVVIGKDGRPIPVAPGSNASRPPTAAEWADSKVVIPNWRALGPNEKPQPGDVAAYKIGQGEFPGATGHSGIVTSVDPDGVVHAIAAHADKIGPDDKFQPTKDPRDRQVIYRRYNSP